MTSAFTLESLLPTVHRLGQLVAQAVAPVQAYCSERLDNRHYG